MGFAGVLAGHVCERTLFHIEIPLNAKRDKVDKYPSCEQEHSIPTSFSFTSLQSKHVTDRTAIPQRDR